MILELPPGALASGPSAAGAGRLRLLALLLLPALLLCLLQGPVRRARGPGWACINFDPEYQYLLNGLNAARGKPVGHADHPGTPVQILNGLFLRVRHIVSGKGSIEDAVLADLESSLRFLQAAYQILYAAGLFWLGAFALARTGRLAPALLLQAAPFVSAHSLLALGRATPETGLLLADLAVAGLLVSAWGGGARDRPYRFAIVSAVLLGFAVALKYTAVPLLALPLILLPRWLPRIAFLALVPASFALCTIPAWHRAGESLGWIAGLLVHQGGHGGGGVGIPAVGVLAENLAGILTGEPVFALSMALLAIALALARSRAPAEGEAAQTPVRRCAAALLAAFVLQCLVVAKHPGMIYLAPAMGLVGAAVWLGAEAIAPALRRPAARRTAAFALGGALSLAIGLGVARPFARMLDGMSQRRDGALAVRERLERDFKGFAVITAWWGSSPEYALFFANVSAEGLYTERLRREHPAAFFYTPDPKLQKIRSVLGWDGQPVDLDSLLRTHRGVLYQGMRFGGGYNPWPPPWFPLREIFRSGEETIYRVEAGARDPGFNPSPVE